LAGGAKNAADTSKRAALHLSYTILDCLGLTVMVSSRPALAVPVPEERLLFARCLPATYAGQFTGWMPQQLCKLRNYTVVLLLIEAAFAIASVGLSSVRLLLCYHVLLDLLLQQQVTAFWP
jgi:hypothetical protein